jgi:WXXGXW repeat (2 copies)
MPNRFLVRSVFRSSVVLYCLSLTLLALAMSTASFGQFRVAVTFEPPALPVYEQPICPGDGYIWTPGYWAWDDDVEDYYWVPGTWILAPEVGYLWTPAWWGWGGEGFIFHEGYWGPRIGFYGGINYGFGYFGEGYEGGRWEHGRFFYNRAVTNVNVTNIRNVYETRVVNENRVNRISYNGGNGGINARPTREQERAARQRHVSPVAAQTQHMHEARGNPQLRASANQGRPPIAATARPGAFNDRAAVPAREAGAPYHPPANRGRAGQPGNEPNRPGNNNSRPANNVHVRDLPPSERRPAPSTGNARLDQKYQKQQQKLSTQQDRERQKLQQRQEQDHQRMAQQRNAQARTQQLEQRHQQQTQQLQQKHEAQQQHMQQRQQPPARQNQSKPPKGKQ